MYSTLPFEPVDYLLIGHIAQDLTPSGPSLGGTVCYSGLTARSMGLKVGIVTSCAPEADLSALEGIQICRIESEFSTTFENIYSDTGRRQIIHHQASPLNLSSIPDAWRKTSIVHLAPIAQEVDPGLARSFTDSTLCLTPQGWLRGWDENGCVSPSEWPEASFVLEKADLAALSMEDVAGDEERINELLSSIRILAVTEGVNGASIFWNGDQRHFRAPQKKVKEETGAGDIFAACFFIRYEITRDPWEACRFANELASCSVTRQGLQSIPTEKEIQTASIEIFQSI
ncbi:MAG: PfkB family carbohydrate kinase [Anaerolineaceae bacterium]